VCLSFHCDRGMVWCVRAIQNRKTKIMFGRGRISGRKTHGEWFVSSDGVYCQTQWFILFKWHFIKVLVALCFLFHDKESNKQNIHGNNGN
jgi:hypothetical protein